MKVIKPEQPIKKENTLIIDNHEVTPFTEENAAIEVNFSERKQLLDELTVLSQESFLYDEEPQTIEEVMDSVLKESTEMITFKISLNKQQYNMWNKKGGMKWLKKELKNVRRKL